jgi:hypothetical protein
MAPRAVKTPPGPDSRTTQKERDARSFRLSAVETDDPVRSFSPQELDDLRQRMSGILANGKGSTQLYAARMITLIDQHERALDLETNIDNALSGDADLEGLEQKITDAEDGIRAELDADTSLDDLGERLLTVPGAELDKIKPVVAEWYGEQLDRIRKEVTEQLGALHAWRVDAQNAVESIQNTDW